MVFLQKPSLGGMVCLKNHPLEGWFLRSQNHPSRDGFLGVEKPSLGGMVKGWQVWPKAWFRKDCLTSLCLSAIATSNLKDPRLTVTDFRKKCAFFSILSSSELRMFFTFKKNI